MSTTSSRPTAFQSPMRVSVLLFQTCPDLSPLLVHAERAELFMSNSYMELMEATAQSTGSSSSHFPVVHQVSVGIMETFTNTECL